MRPYFLDFSILAQIAKINAFNIILLYAVAIFYFLLLPRWLFPQRYSGGGIEKNLSNILYMLAFTELVVPLMVFLKIFTLFTFFAAIIATKMFFLHFYEKRDIKEYFLGSTRDFLLKIYDFLDDVKGNLLRWKNLVSTQIFLYFKNLNYYQFFKKLLIVFVFIHLIYILGYRCLVSMAYPLPDTSQFVEWVANLQNNVLYADNKTGQSDFYGISVFIFTLKTLSNIDSIVLFNIYPLLLITFLLFGVYFVLKRFSLISLVALAALLVYGSVLVGSPLDQYISTGVVSTNQPEIIRFLFIKFYQIPHHYLLEPEKYLENDAMIPYIRYFSGMAYEFSSSMFLVNLFYLIKSIDTGRGRYLINYTLSLMLVFILHGGGAIILIVPSILIFFHALLSFKLNWILLKRGIISIAIAAILGNGWILSMLKYGIPQDFGAAAPFLDKLFGTKQAIQEVVASGIEDVTISYLSPLHLWILLLTLFFFIMARIGKKGFYFASFLLIPIGVFIVYFAENLGLPSLVHPSRGAEYLYLAVVIVVACVVKFFLWTPLKFIMHNRAKLIMLVLVAIELLLSIFIVPHYKESEDFKRYINGVQYSDIPLFLYRIIHANRPHTWTVVSYVQEFSKVLGKGYMINANDFIVQFDPRSKYLKIPTPKIYIFVEDIPHSYTGKDEWYYRWRPQIENQLKEWVSIYSSLHDNIKIFAKSHLVTVYEIDNSAYMKHLQRMKDVQ